MGGRGAHLGDCGQCCRLQGKRPQWRPRVVDIPRQLSEADGRALPPEDRGPALLGIGVQVAQHPSLCTAPSSHLGAFDSQDQQDLWQLGQLCESCVRVAGGWGRSFSAPIVEEGKNEH